MTARPCWSKRAVAGIVLAAAVTATAGCSDDDDSANSDATTSTALSMPAHDGSFRPADELAALAGCDDAVPASDATVIEGEPEPVESLVCGGEASAFTIATYASDADLDAALAAQDATCGFRVVGERWMVIVDVPEAADELSETLGGAVVELAGC